MLNLDLKSWWYKRIVSKKRADKKKKTTHLTMMVVPHGHGAAVKSICFPMWLVKGFMAVSLSCILIVGYFVTGFFYLRYVAVENKELKEINTAQEKELKELQGMAGSMRSKLDALMKLDQEVRSKMGLGKNGSAESSLKVESSRAESRYEFITMGLGGPGQSLGKHGYVTAMVPYIEETATEELLSDGPPNTQDTAENTEVLTLPASDEEINTLDRPAFSSHRVDDTQSLHNCSP